jgi:hypothetical protein
MQRPADLLARYGDEEFAAILPGTDAAGATALAERLRATLAQLNIVHGESALGYVSLSAGVAARDVTADAEPAEFVAQADEALYDAKISGRNCVRTAGQLSHAHLVGRVATAPRSNLPTGLTPLVGRLGEVAAIRTLLETNRLVTVVGMGGIGKTRVAVHAAAAVADGYADGVWFVDLAPIADPALVLGAFARACGQRAIGGDDACEQFAQRLASKHALVVVDNCEHLLADAASISATLLRTCPRVRVLATSREPFGIVGESRYRLPLLSLPPADPQLRASDALATDAVALFAERARAVQPSFAVVDGNAALVAAIVRRLDGIALAIEIAAAGSPFAPARRKRCERAAASADDERDARLELRSAHSPRANRVPPVVRLRG